MCALAELLSVSSRAARLIFSVSLLFARALLEPGTAHFFCPSVSQHFSTVLLFPSGFLVLHYVCLGVGSFSVILTRGPQHYMRQGLTTLVFQLAVSQNCSHIPELHPYSRTAHIPELPPYLRTAPTSPSLYLLKFMKSWILFID